MENGKWRKILHFPFSIFNLFVLFMQPVATAATAKLFKLKPVRRVLFVLCRHVITLFALGALQNYVISWHISSVQSYAFTRELLHESRLKA
jgi:hypothetical protein